MASYNQFNYNYRPAKTIERKLFIELLKELYGVVNSKNTTYVGLGSIYFTDFRLVHKELGISKMINIEYNEKDRNRFEYNKPFACINLEWGMTTEILPGLDWDGKKILWLDYDQTPQVYMLEDVETVFSNIAADSFFFLSCNSSFQRFYDKDKTVHDVERFKAEFEQYSPLEITAEMLTNKKSPYLIRKMINNEIKHVLDQRNAGILDEGDKLIYCQLLFIIYQDGAPMFSTGGILKTVRDLRKFAKSKIFSLPYIRTAETFLDLQSPLLTNSEIDLLNTFLPNLKKKRFLNAGEIDFIPEVEKDKYYEIYRYYPSFVEIRDF